MDRRELGIIENMGICVSCVGWVVDDLFENLEKFVLLYFAVPRGVCSLDEEQQIMMGKMVAFAHVLH